MCIPAHFDTVFIFTLQNPLQVVVNAIINSGPREDSTRIGRAGTVRRQAVDVSPLRRVNQAIWLLCTGAREAAFRNIKTIAECLADELINAAKVRSTSHSPRVSESAKRHFTVFTRRKTRTKRNLLRNAFSTACTGCFHASCHSLSFVLFSPPAPNILLMPQHEIPP